MNIILAHSAFHRATLLGASIPLERIKSYIEAAIHAVSQYFSGCLSQLTSLPVIAAIIMMAAMAFTSCSPPEVCTLLTTCWRLHWSRVRTVIKNSWFSVTTNNDPTFSFLTRWLFYLECMYSVNSTEPIYPLIFERYGDDAWRSPVSPEPDKDDCQIDCMWGMTLRGLSRLTKIGQLAHLGRRGLLAAPNIFFSGMRDVVRSLQAQLESGTRTGLHGFRYQWKCNMDNALDHHDMLAINYSFQCAGLIQLNRRVLRRPSAHADVQFLVTNALSELDRVNIDRIITVNSLFPLLHAGCEVQTQDQKAKVLHRFEAMERLGLIHVGLGSATVLW